MARSSHKQDFRLVVLSLRFGVHLIIEVTVGEFEPSSLADDAPSLPSVETAHSRGATKRSSVL
jgi:hypothetical protein